MQTRFIYLLRIFIAISDVFLVNGVLYVLGMFAGETFHSGLSESGKYCFLLVNFIWLSSSIATGLYSNASFERLELLYRNTGRSWLMHFFICSGTLLFLGNRQLLLSAIGIFYPVLGLGLLMSRFAGTYIQVLLVRKFPVRKSVAIIGNDQGGRRLASYFNAHGHNYQFLGFLSESHALFINERGEITPEGAGQLKRAVDDNIDEVYVSVSPGSISSAAALVQEAERQCIRVKLVPDLNAGLEVPYDVSYIGDMPVLSTLHQPAYMMKNRFKKRVFDLLVSSIVIILILSWLYPLLAIIIKLDSRGPVLFRQLRTGRHNKPFWCYKFRSMRVNADSDKKQAVKGDPRITRLGSFMRKTSIDELPQFFNVWQGKMSIVGPRPHMLKHTEEYSTIIDQYMVRQFLKPGITGWAQVNGYRGETKEASLMERRVAHDIWYMQSWSTTLDVRIVFMTVINMISGDKNAG